MKTYHHISRNNAKCKNAATYKVERIGKQGERNSKPQYLRDFIQILVNSLRQLEEYYGKSILKKWQPVKVNEPKQSIINEKRLTNWVP